jgi:hypothetical protein
MTFLKKGRHHSTLCRVWMEMVPFKVLNIECFSKLLVWWQTQNCAVFSFGQSRFVFEWRYREDEEILFVCFCLSEFEIFKPLTTLWGMV